ncbi:hypothetical protein [Actinospongicola halichondriae]|uniref:hypothetical protein n=1 Tax=Actinospongicola halichondriae TaxID=3236844 RepID=UPI003D5AA1FC
MVIINDHTTPYPQCRPRRTDPMHQLPSRSSVVVSVPATSAHLRHLRVLAATVAADAGFGIDAIESMRVAIDELCALAMADATDDAVLTLTIQPDVDGITMEGSCGPVTDDPVVDPIAAQLLAAGSASHSLSRDGDDCHFELRIDRPTSANDDDVDGR